MSQGPVIGLVRYGAGNAGAVTAALEAQGASVRQVTDPWGLDDPAVSALVLPGVGAMPAAVQGLKERGLWQPLRDKVAAGGMPLLGVCLGMQLLFGPSEEGDAGLGLLPGRTVRLRGRRVPHLGWARVAPDRAAGLFSDWKEPSYAYFAHSYAVVDVPEDMVAARTEGEEEGEGVVAAVASGQIHGVQFHPERSQGAGLAVLARFVSRVASA